MFVVLKIALFFVIIETYSSPHSLCAVPQDKCEDELVFAHVIFRHGNRTIFGGEKTIYTEDPYQDPNYWPEGFGQLTSIGKRTEYRFGQYLRRRYDKLIGPKYSPNKVYIQSVDSDRCLQSAELAAAGIYPPNGDDIWNASISWQPIPIHTRPQTEDYILYQKLPKCDIVERDIGEYLKSDAHRKLIAEHKELIEFIEHNSGAKMERFRLFYDVYTALIIEHSRGLVLSDWALKVLTNYSREMSYLTSVGYVISHTRTTAMKKAIPGFLIKEMFDRFKTKALKTLSPDRSLWLYSVNEHALVSTLDALNLFDYQMPPFGASLHLELYKCGDEYYVQIFYRKSNDEILMPMDIPKCGTKCPLDKLFTVYKDILPKDNETRATLCSGTTYPFIVLPFLLAPIALTHIFNSLLP